MRRERIAIDLTHAGSIGHPVGAGSLALRQHNGFDIADEFRVFPTAPPGWDSSVVPAARVILELQEWLPRYVKRNTSG